MAEPARADARYTAFLSYSHTDAAAAARLHRRLEAYRIPTRLVGAETARGPVPRRLWPIFRDREELPAASDLSETVRAALAESGALIILCSPAAAASLWVAEEIETFRRLHPDRPILAAILDGDPPACFPEKLRAFGQDGTWHEPLATDLRPGKDGNHLGLLKLVAGITGLGLDDLVQRDAARRVRRVTAITVAAVMAMVIMAALAMIALNARREADRQRAEVGRQIEFMITDLRDRLRSVGRLDVLDAVNRHALDYYRRQNLDDLDPDSLERRARVLQAMGEDDLSRGQLPVARAAFDDAYRTTAEQLAREPNNPLRIFNHGHSEYWVGRVHELRREWPEARRRYALYAAAAERLIAIAPNNPDYMLEMAWGASNRGVVQRDGDRNYAAAIASFRIAIGWFERALQVRSRAGDARDLANAYADLADCYHGQHDWLQAWAARFHSYQILEPLSRAKPADLDLAFRLAIAERAVATESIRAGNPTNASHFMLSAYRRARLLTAHDPANVEWRIWRAKVECDLLNPTLGLRAGLSRSSLQRHVRATIAPMPHGSPRLEEFRPCRAHLGMN